MKGFCVAGGSVPGTDHTKPGQPGWVNNHDAFAWHAGDDCLIAVVCDGCGSTPHPEVGAHIGARLVLKALAESLPFTRNNPLFNVERMIQGERFALGRRLKDIALSMSHRGDVRQTMLDYFLFTIVGVVITHEQTVVFSLGDGVFAVNGEVHVIGPYQDNMPPYLAYTQMPGLFKDNLDFVIRASLPTDHVQSVLIGSDGVADLIEAAELPLPGKTEPVGPLSQFWSDPRFADNPDAIRRRLAMINRERVDEGHIRKGLLHDDTTLIVIKQTQDNKE